MAHLGGLAAAGTFPVVLKSSRHAFRRIMTAPFAARETGRLAPPPQLPVPSTLLDTAAPTPPAGVRGAWVEHLLAPRSDYVSVLVSEALQLPQEFVQGEAWGHICPVPIPPRAATPAVFERWRETHDKSCSPPRPATQSCCGLVQCTAAPCPHRCQSPHRQGSAQRRRQPPLRPASRRKRATGAAARSARRSGCVGTLSWKRAVTSGCM